MRPRKLVCYFMALVEAIYMSVAGVIPWSHDILYHPKTLVFDLS